MKRQLLIFASLFIDLIAMSQTIAGGYSHSFSICNSSDLMSWGWNGMGALGNGNNNTSYVPVQVNSISGVIAISSGAYHCLALKNDGTVWGWGANSNGELGNGTINNSNIPIQVSVLSGITAISGGSNFSLALKNDSTIWAWGSNPYGLGNGLNFSNVPVQINSLSGIISISAGGSHSLALKNDGTVWAWGWNNFGELGNGITGGSSSFPIQVNSLSGIIAIAAGWHHSIALKYDGTVWVWGYNFYGQIGDGINTDSNIPVLANLNSVKIIAVAAGYAHTLALANNGLVWSWGDNNFRELGNGTNNSNYIPALVDSLYNVEAISAGWEHSLALKRDGTLWDWGLNTAGQLGNGNNINTSIPREISGLCQVSTFVSETNSSMDISTFPNPWTTETILKTDKNLSNAILTIYNSTGQKVKQIKNILGQTITLFRDNLPSGLYFLYLTQDNQIIATKKIIIAD